MTVVLLATEKEVLLPVTLKYAVPLLSRLLVMIYSLGTAGTMTLLLVELLPPIINTAFLASLLTPCDEVNV